MGKSCGGGGGGRSGGGGGGRSAGGGGGGHGGGGGRAVGSHAGGGRVVSHSGGGSKSSAAGLSGSGGSKSAAVSNSGGGGSKTAAGSRGGASGPKSGGQASAAVAHRANQLNPLHANYWSSRGIQPAPTQTVYHGTSSVNAKSIMKQGFKASGDGLLGSGIYVTTDKSKAQAFAGSDGTVVKALANFGRVGTVDARAAREHGYSDRSWKPHCDTAFVPKGEGVARPEHCVQDPQRVVPVGTFPS